MAEPSEWATANDAAAGNEYEREGPIDEAREGVVQSSRQAECGDSYEG